MRLSDLRNQPVPHQEQQSETLQKVSDCPFSLSRQLGVLTIADPESNQPSGLQQTTAYPTVI